MAAVLTFEPQIAAWPEAPQRVPDLRRCLVLAGLLHLLLVLMFGTVTGTAPPGEGLSGTLNVRLAGGGPAAEEAPQPTPPAAYTGPTGQADDRRWGGAVRERAPAPPQADAPGAAQEGTYNPVPTARSADPLPPENPAAADAPPAVGRLAASPQVTPLRPSEPLAPAPPPLASPLPPVAPLPELAPLPPALRTLAPPAPPTTAPQARPLDRVAPLEAPALPGPAAAPAALPLPPAPLPTRTLTPPPTTTPPPPVQPLPRVRPMDELALPPPARAPEAWPAPAAAPPAGPSLPAASPATPADAPATPAAPTLPTAPTAPAAAAQTPSPDAGTPTTLPPVSTPPAGAAGPATAPPRPSFGAPDAGAQLGHDVATPAAAPASAPRLNLELPRQRGGELPRIGSKGMLNLLPPPPERKDKLAEDIEKAAKPDCRTVYSGLGVLAVVPLAVDTVRKDGCRW